MTPLIYELEMMTAKKLYCWSTVKFSDFFKTVNVKGKSGKYRQINFGQFATNIIARLFLTTVKIS